VTIRNAFKFVVTLTLVFAVVGAYGVFTAKASMGSASSVISVNHPPAATARTVLKGTKVVSGSSGVALPAGTFTTIDGTTLGCPGLSGTTCTYEVENYLQILASATSNWALLTTIDGNFIGQGGPFLGLVGTDFTAGSWSDVGTSFAVGPHSIATLAYMRDNAATAYNYSFNYRVYKP
jgi:hypothetical protein